MKNRVKIHLLLFICLIALLFLCCDLKAQEWPKVYGDNFHSLLSEMHETYDKGIYLSGFIYSPYGFCRYIWIIKSDINGNILWEKKIGDSSHQFWLSGSSNSSDNGLVFSGVTTKYNIGDFDPLFVKMNVCGEIEWCKVLVCPDQNYGTDVIQTSDGSFIGLLTYYGAEETYARISLVKMDQSGEPIWIQRLAQEDTLIYNEEGYHLLKTNDSSYLISGRVYYPGMKPYWIMTDTVGQETWDLKWSGVVGICFQTIEHQPGIFYSIGYKIPPGHNNLPTIYRFNGSGNQFDNFLILGDTINQGGGGALSTINDSTLLTGIVWSSVNNSEECKSEVILIDTLGNLINRRLLLLDDHSPTSIILSSDNKALVAGTYYVDGNFDIYLWKMNTNLGDDTLYTQPLTYDSLCPYEIQSDTLDLDCGLFVNIEELPTKEEYESTIKISPNPATDWVTFTLPDVVASGEVEVMVYDIFGREAWRRGGMGAWRQGDRRTGGLGDKGIAPVNRIITLNISAYTEGMYIAVVLDGKDRRYTGKFVVR